MLTLVAELAGLGLVALPGGCGDVVSDGVNAANECNIVLAVPVKVQSKGVEPAVATALVAPAPVCCPLFKSHLSVEVVVANVPVLAWHATSVTHAPLVRVVMLVVRVVAELELLVIAASAACCLTFLSEIAAPAR